MKVARNLCEKIRDDMIATVDEREIERSSSGPSPSATPLLEGEENDAVHRLDVRFARSKSHAREGLFD